MPKKYERVTEGYWGNRHTEREKQWYAALSEKVGYKNAPKYADDIINWQQARPPDHLLARWLNEYDNGDWPIDDAIRVRVENKVDRFHKQEHMGFLRQMLKAGKKALAPLEATGDMRQPVILKYIADGVNQGFLMHNDRQKQTEGLQMGGLTINIGQKPPPRKLRQRDVDAIQGGALDQIIEAEVRELPVGQPAS